MYRVYQKDLYDEHPKAHFVSTQAIMNEVRDDLQIRFGGIVAELEEDSSCMWDPGGMMMADDEVFEFKLENITVLCKAQHFEYFAAVVDKYANEPNVRGDKAKYVKLHGAYSCICITPFELGQLVLLTKNDDFVQRAEKSWAERERRLNALQDAGCIVRVVKDDDGNLHPLQNNVDKKNLN